jgi:hypothetical protein
MSSATHELDRITIALRLGLEPAVLLQFLFASWFR